MEFAMNNAEEKHRTVAVRLPASVADAVEARAKLELLSMSAFCRRTLAQACAPRDQYELERTIG